MLKGGVTHPFLFGIYMLVYFLLTLGCYKSHIESGEWLPGGETTNTLILGSNAFIFPAENISIANQPSFYSGNSFFNQAWVETPSSTIKRDGLGPLFNARSCAACHFKDGRAQPPTESMPHLGLLFRASISGEDENGSPLGHDNYGGQLQPFSVLQGTPEIELSITYEYITGAYGDGEVYKLQKPVYSFPTENYGTLSSDVMLSPRIAPAVIGMGLLEAIPQSRIEELEDPNDQDGNGISGTINWVWDFSDEVHKVGRFGWKSEQPTVKQQVASAFVEDIGITNPVFMTESCGEHQTDCKELPSGGDPEIEQDLFDKVVLYTSLLAVPIRRDWEEKDVLNGKMLFSDIGCADCHTPNHHTESHEFPELSNQSIWPYTDLLLHDMGEGLADHRPVFDANGQEWRTPPLWGIGLVKTVNKHTRFLHDGRARNLTEAILWHGGEAKTAQQNFINLSKTEREEILTFVNSL